MPIKTVRALLDALRQGRFSSVGGYPLFFLTHDGECLDPATVRAEIWQIARAVRDQARWNAQWLVVAHDVNWESMDMVDAHTNEPIECAYPAE